MRGSNAKDSHSGGGTLICGTLARVVDVFVAQISSAIIVQKSQLKIMSSFRHFLNRHL